MTDVAFEVIDGQEASYYRKEKESDTIDGHITKVPYVIDEDANASLASMAQASSNIAISISSSGDNTIKTPAPGKALRIVHITLVAASSVAVIPKLGATVLTGAIPILAFTDSEKPYLWAGAANEAFKLNLSDAVAVAGYLLYYEV